MAKNGNGNGNGGFGTFLGGLLIGGAAGSVVAMLFAPQSGKKTRDKLMDKAETTYTDAQRKMSERLNELQNKIDKMTTQVDESVNRMGKSASEGVGHLADTISPDYDQQAGAM
jgi:gas vesicle protein